MSRPGRGTVPRFAILTVPSCDGCPDSAGAQTILATICKVWKFVKQGLVRDYEARLVALGYLLLRHIAHQSRFSNGLLEMDDADHQHVDGLAIARQRQQQRLVAPQPPVEHEAVLDRADRLPRRHRRGIALAQMLAILGIGVIVEHLARRIAAGALDQLGADQPEAKA